MHSRVNEGYDLVSFGISQPVSFAASAGTAYYVQVDGYAFGLPDGNIVLSWTPTARLLRPGIPVRLAGHGALAAIPFTSPVRANHSRLLTLGRHACDGGGAADGDPL